MVNIQYWSITLILDPWQNIVFNQAKAKLIIISIMQV